MPPQNKENRKRGKKNEVDLDDEEYRKKRDRNNLVCVFIKMMKKLENGHVLQPCALNLIIQK